MKKNILAFVLFCFSILTINAQQAPSISGPGIDIGTYAVANTEQTYTIKYMNGSATSDQKKSVQWTIDESQCTIVKKNGNDASITLKWKNPGMTGKIEAYNVYTTSGLKKVTSPVSIRSNSIGDIVISAPTAAKTSNSINISVEIKNTIGHLSVNMQANDFTKTSSSTPNYSGHFTSPGVKTITVTAWGEGIPSKTVTKNITVIPDIIDGPDAIIQNNQNIYRLLNAPSGNYVWTVSNNLQIVSGQGTSQISIKHNGGTIGTGTIQVSTLGLTLTKSIAVGVPDANKLSVTLGTNNTLYAYFTERNESRATYSGAGSILEYEWESTGWEVFNPLTSNKSTVFLKAKYTPASSMANIKVRARNNAGWGGWMLFGAQVDNSRSRSYNIQATSGMITVSKEEQPDKILKEKTTRNNSPVIYEIYNQYTGIIVKKGTLGELGGTIDTSNLSNGIYILSLIIDSSNRQTDKILIQH